ncbi:hypothetical protein D187_005392 [Cystobacter fuscus DSM 2262]|uniref:DUF2378 family protein n=1 Tax=Cystobacter fuscus (strain ATCC 25194 / DSM 2262 / NBRC 100088 / M29) TaxID=1242864 RepID=S9R5L1_CYSF2|nr:hypothetical protein D187_005392 [Cystobacter fuscus DSM 2262]
MQGLERSSDEGSLPEARERWVFEHTVAGLFRSEWGSRLSAPALQALSEVGVDLSRPLLPAYSSETWARALRIAAADLFPGQPPQTSWRRLGQEVIHGLVHTLVGNAMVNVATLLGPLRFLRRLNPTLRNADNYVESRVEELGPTSCEVWFNEVMEQPAYHQGLLEALVGLAGGRDARARFLSSEGPGARFLVEWEAPEAG